MNRKISLACAATLLATTALGTALGTTLATTAAAGEPEWIRQIGTGNYDSVTAVATGAGGRVHVVGATFGNFAPPNKGEWDALVVTYDPDGNELWRRQPGSSRWDSANAVTTDANGNVYVVGETSGSFGGPQKGDRDTFVIKFDADGRILWRRQPGSSDRDLARAVTTDADGNVYMAGSTDGALGGTLKGGADAFLIKLDPEGRTLWKRQPGTTAEDYAHGVATDADGSVYVTGWTFGSLGGPLIGPQNAFLIKYDRDGHILWKRQTGMEHGDWSEGVATDADGNVYIAGGTVRSLGNGRIGRNDAFVIKFDTDGRKLWRSQFSSSGDADDRASAVATDADGNLIVAGRTYGEFSGPSNGAEDAFVIKFTPDGSVVWKDQQGSTGFEDAPGVAADSAGNVYVVGTTDGTMPGTTKRGHDDGFLIKYGPDGPQ